MASFYFLNFPTTGTGLNLFTTCSVKPSTRLQAAQEPERMDIREHSLLYT